MSATRLVTRPASRVVRYTWRTALKMAAATVFGCLFGWWWDRPGLVRDRAMESPFERRAQYCAVLFWPPFALWLTASAPGAPRWLSAVAEWTLLGTLPAWVWGVLLTPFACVVIARRVMAAHGRPWRLHRLVRDLRTWAALHRVVVGVSAGFCLLLLARWATGHSPALAAVYGFPGGLAMMLTLAAAERQAAFLRKTDRLNGRLSRVLGVTESAMKEQAVYVPGRNGDIVLAHFPAAAIDHIDADFDTRVVEHFGSGSSIKEDPDPATGLVRRFVIRSTVDLETATDRMTLANTRGLVTHLEPGADLPHRPGHQIAHLHPSVSATRGADVDAVLAEAYGLRVVEWRPEERAAYCATLRPRTDELRDSLCRELGVKEPWSIEIGVTADQTGPQRVTVFRSPRFGDATKRTEAWTDVAALLLPASAGERWRVDDDPAARVVTLIREHDPLLLPLTYDEDPSQRIPVTTPWRLGRDEAGQDIRLDLASSAHGLIAGATRSGKSVATYSLITHVLRMGGAARLLVADPNDTTIAPFEDKVSWSTTSTHPDEVTAMLEWARAEMDERKPILRAMEQDKIEPHQFDDDLPLIVIVIDEAANYLRHSDKNAAAALTSELLAVVSQGAKYGIRVILITQRPDSTILSTAIRAQLSWRISFRIEDLETAKMVFPDLDDPAGLLSCQPGVGYMRLVGEPARRFRAFYLADHWGASKAIREPLPRVNVAGTNPEGAVRQSAQAHPSVEVATETVDVSLEDLDAYGDDFDTEDEVRVPVPPVPANLWD